MGKYREVTTELLELVAQHKSGKEISRILNLDYSTVHSKLRKLNINLPNYHNTLKFDNTVFDIIDTEEKAYWLGFLYADGYISSTNNTVELSLKSTDYEHLNKFKVFLQYRGDVKISSIKCKDKSYSRCRLSVTDKHFHDRLVRLGCIPKKSLILKFPSLNIFSNKDLVIDFIRGYIDGDGCLSFTSNGRLTVQIVGTKEFLDGIISIFPQIFSKRRKDKRSLNNTYTLDCACSKADYIASKLYEKATIYLDRKYERYKRFAVLSSN